MTTSIITPTTSNYSPPRHQSHNSKVSQTGPCPEHHFSNVSTRDAKQVSLLARAQPLYVRKTSPKNWNAGPLEWIVSSKNWLPLCYLSLHRVADGYVALNGEGGKGEGRWVHGQELTENHEAAAQAAPHPEVAQNVVLGHLGHSKIILWGHFHCESPLGALSWRGWWGRQEQGRRDSSWWSCARTWFLAQSPLPSGFQTHQPETRWSDTRLVTKIFLGFSRPGRGFRSARIASCSIRDPSS